MDTENKIETVSNLVRQAIKDRRQTQIAAVSAIFGLVAMALYLVFYTDNSGSLVLLVFIGMAIAGVLYLGNVWFEKNAANSIMPVLCEIVGGLSYANDDTAVSGWMISNNGGLFPKADREFIRHKISGKIADIQFDCWVCSLRDMGEETNELVFNGLVIEIINANPITNILIRPTEGPFSKLVGSGSYKPMAFQSDREIPTFGIHSCALYLHSKDHENEVLDWVQPRIFSTNNLMVGENGFYGLLQTGNKLFLAIQTKSETHKFGGLFVRESKIMENVEQILDEILLPLKIIQIWQK